MKGREVHERATAELKQMQVDLRRELWKAKFDHAASQLEKTSTIQRLRRDIARVETVLGERTRSSSAQTE